ncbi:restriction endonuclease subunit S [Turicibacter bilis]|uniref:restriction endonuclease subunit S n=1 Tax=Turicibacter bilis TaxID=2735723 RepID=UPI0031BB5DB4
MNCKLKDVLADKGYIRGPFGSALKRNEMKEQGIPVYEQQNAIYNSRDFRYFIDNEKFKSLSRFQVATNDLIVSCSGTVGKVSIIREEDCKGIISQALLILRPNTNKIIPKYLYYFFLSSKGYNSIISRSSGSVQVNIAKRDIIENIELEVPSLEIQQKVVDILSSLDDKIELNNQMNETLEEMAQALFKRWFVDFEFPNEEGKPYKSSGGEMVESELGMIPKGWNIKLASEVVDVKDGTHASPKVVNEGYPLITSKHINGDRLRIEEANLISETDYVEVNKRSKVDTGDILISMIGTVGLLYYVQDLDVNFAIKNLGLFKTSKTVEMQEYIYLYLKQTSMKNYIECRLAGTTQKYISLTELRKIPVLLPTCDLLHTFKEKIEPLLKMKQENINQNQSLVNIRSTLLPKLMSGEIRVSDFES